LFDSIFLPPTAYDSDLTEWENESLAARELRHGKEWVSMAGGCFPQYSVTMLE